MKSCRFFPVLTAMMMATVLLHLTACHEDEFDTPQSYTYELAVFGSTDSRMFTIDKISSKLTQVTSNASWLTVSAEDELNGDGHPVISIESSSPSKDGAEAIIEVVAENGDRATISVLHSSMPLSDAESGANSGWESGWYDYETVALQGFQYAQKTPWTVEGSGNVPEELRKQIYPEEGWEMVFSYLNDNSLEGVRYFALYNKWTGQVRLYTYVVDPTGWGSDLVLNVYFGSVNDNDMYPLYNVFEYGIPTCHTPGKNLSRYAKLLSAQNQTFQTWLSPYRQSRSLTPGWYCFEFDMSGYVPEGKDWLKPTQDAPRFKFFAETDNNQTVSLKGTLSGSIKGTFEDPQIIQHGGANATSGILSALGGGLSAISGMASGSIAGGSSYANLMKNGGAEGISGVLNPIKFWGGFACSIAGGLFSAVAPFTESPVSYEKIPGKIDLTLDATMELDGYIKSATSNSLRALSVSPRGIYSANGENGHVGKGVWSLAEDPVVYIDTEDVISSQSSFNLLCTSTGYSLSNFANYDVRIVYAFDPTSVKVNINKDLFREIQDVTITANVGVLPNYPYGHTDSYRNMLTFGERPSFSLSEGKTSGTVELNQKSIPYVNRVPLNALADGEYETAGNCSVVAQKKSDGTEWQRYHGRLIDIPELGKQIIVDPQVYIPYSLDENGKCKEIGFPQSPDFVVRIDLEFTALDDQGERKLFQFGKLYIPKVVLVDYDGMSAVCARLKDYSAKCEAGQPICTLANDENITAHFPGGHKLIAKTLRLLELLDM